MPLQSWSPSPIPSHPFLSQPPDILPNKVFLVRRLTALREALPVRATALAEVISSSLFKCKCTVFKFRPRVSYTGMVEPNKGLRLVLDTFIRPQLFCCLVVLFQSFSMNLSRLSVQTAKPDNVSSHATVIHAALFKHSDVSFRT